MREQAWEQRLVNALTGAAEPALLLVEGAAWMGKTRLVRRLLDLPEARSVTRLVVSCRPSGGLSVAVPGASRAANGAAPVGRPKTPQGVQVRTSPTPGEPPYTTAGDSDDPDRDAHRVLAAALASVRPVLLVVEDVHHAADRCLEVLRGLLAEPPARFAAVLTYRPEQLDRPGLPLRRAVDYPARLAVTRLRLEPLDEDQVGAVARETLGAERCPREFVARLRQCSGGIPQVLIDLLRMLGDASPGKEPFGPRDVDEAGAPVRLAELILDRTAALPEAHRPIVWAAAVLDEPAGARDLAAVAGLDEDAGHAALVAALGACALRETQAGRYGFAVPLAARAVYQELPGAVRERLHHRATKILADRDPVPWARLARHWAAGGRTEDWLRAAAHVADLEGAIGGDEVAVALLEETLDTRSVPPELQGRCALALARNAMLQLRSEKTAQVLRRIVDDPALPERERGEIRLELGLLLRHRKRRFEEGRGELVRSVGELDGRPALAAMAMMALANSYFPGMSLAEHRGWMEHAVEAASASRDPVTRAVIAAGTVTHLMNCGDPAAWDALERLPRTGAGLAERQQLARGVGNAANGAVFLGHLGRAGELLAEGIDRAARNSAPYLENLGRGTALFHDYMTGCWDGLAERCTSLVAEEGTGNDARVVVGLLAMARGEWSTARTWLPCAEPSSFDQTEVPLASVSAGGHIRMLLGQRAAEAATLADSAWSWLRGRGVWVWGAELAPWAVHALVGDGRRDAARDLVEEFAAGLADRDAPSAAAALLWCRALVAEAEGELDEAVAGYRASSRAYGLLPRPYARALTAEAAGHCALSAGQGTEEATQDLVDCVELLSGLGATWDASRARATLRVHRPAVRRRPGRPAYTDRLSPREGEVAELAAAGLTNREIAATLHLSPRTVEQHIARAMRKVGADCRQGLAEHVPAR
ncbi:ATP-binding protein [Spirillospora sp. CA-294931]|uniref:ATP-binding protein n=1 Tax=Spirillospora sp. CA-294931 TaxID=3240042 RepID=UPI003D8D78AD